MATANPSMFPPGYLEENRGPGYRVVIAFTISLATIAVILRLMARRLSAWKVGKEDLLIIAALVSIDDGFCGVLTSETVIRFLRGQ